MIKVLTLIVLITLCLALPGNLGTYTGFIKPNLYELNLQASDKIEVTTTWKSTLSPRTSYEFDLFLYKKGVNFISNLNAIEQFNQPGIKP